MALTACWMVSCPAAAWWILVCTAALNCTYHGGAPFGNGACAWALRIAASLGACAAVAAADVTLKLDSLAGRGNVLTTFCGPCSPAQFAWLSVAVDHLMNITAPATFWPTPVAPGVGMYSVSPTTLDEAGTL